MRVLIVLTYYRPHTSGLTIYAEHLARAMVARGHTGHGSDFRYDKSLPAEEVMDGVRVVRAPVLFRVSKGCDHADLRFDRQPAGGEHDVIHLHLPQFDAAGIALRGRLPCANRPSSPITAICACPLELWHSWQTRRCA
jgi:glycosyltransferase involved in cell wall biosynthesis